MKKRSYLIAAGCTVVLYALSACSDHAANDTAQAGNPETMSVAEARRYFERVAAPTRAGSEEGTLTLGTYMPDWSLATVSAGEVLSSTDVPVRGEFRYFRYRIDEYGEPRFTPIYHKLVVVKDSRSGVMSSYLRFYVPDPDYAAGRTADDYDRLLNSGSKGDFTGLAVYTSLDGFPVHAVRYAGGACQAEAFLYDKSRTQAENTARLGEMLAAAAGVVRRVRGDEDEPRVLASCRRADGLFTDLQLSGLFGKADQIEQFIHRLPSPFPFLRRRSRGWPCPARARARGICAPA